MVFSALRDCLFAGCVLLRFSSFVAEVLGHETWLSNFDVSACIPTAIAMFISRFSPSFGLLVSDASLANTCHDMYRFLLADGIYAASIFARSLVLAFTSALRVPVYLIDRQSWTLMIRIRYLTIPAAMIGLVQESRRKIEKNYCDLNRVSSTTCLFAECVACLEDLESGQEIAIHRTCREFYHRTCLRQLLTECTLGSELCRACRQPLGRFATIQYIEDSQVGWCTEVLRSLTKWMWSVSVGSIFLTLTVLSNPNKQSVVKLKIYLIDLLLPGMIASLMLWTPCNAAAGSPRQHHRGGTKNLFSVKILLPWVFVVYIVVVGEIWIGYKLSRSEVLVFGAKGLAVAVWCVWQSGAMVVPTDLQKMSFKEMRVVTRDLWLCIAPWFRWLLQFRSQTVQPEEQERERNEGD